MKKITGTLLIVACLFMAIPAQAQFQWGLKAGLNLNKADFSGLKDNFKAENMTGFFVGPMAEFTVPLIGIGVDASLLYSQRGSKISYAGINGSTDKTSKQHAIDIPVNLKYSIGLGDFASVFVTAGPDFVFNLSNDNLLEQLGDISGEDISIKNAAKKAEIGMNVGLGVKLINHLQLAVNYNIPFGNSAKKNITDDPELNTILDKNFKAKNRIWQVSLAYMF